MKVLLQSVTYLAHPFPRVRRSASEEIYLVITTIFVDVERDPEMNGDEEDLAVETPQDDGLEKVENLLLTTNWDLPCNDLKPVRDTIKDILLRYQE